jgi:NAD(P)-dependent dehydrogenase (short-subunit alcohol dehydrogenase family)
MTDTFSKINIADAADIASECMLPHATPAGTGLVDGKTAVVLGGTSGIGAAAASLLVEEGAVVVIAGRRVGAGEALAERLGANASFVRCDVIQERQVEQLMTSAHAALGRIDGVINCAGDGGAGGGAASLELDGVSRTLALHLGGTLAAMKHAARVMLEYESGSIVNVASIAGRAAGWTSLSYSVAKAAVIHATRCAAVELGEQGVRVNSVSPGPTLTGIFAKSAGVCRAVADEQAGLLDSVFTSTLANWQALRRAAVPNDIAPACVWLISEASRWVNGHDLVIDGGISAGRPASVSAGERALIAEALRAASHPGDSS